MKKNFIVSLNYLWQRVAVILQAKKNGNSASSMAKLDSYRKEIRFFILRQY